MKTATVPTLSAHSGSTHPLPSPDFIIEGSLGDDISIVGPCHRAAAAWLHQWAEPSSVWVGEGMALEDDDIRDFITTATRVGFSVQLRVGDSNSRSSILAPAMVGDVL